MSASISSKELLESVRRGEFPPDEITRELGENSPTEFFRDIVEPLADSFDPAQASAYERLMQAWVPAMPAATPSIPTRIDTLYVLSRVTLGADIKIVSPILATMKQRFPNTKIVFIANRKSAELFAADKRIEHLNADYPRTGPVSARIEFAQDLRTKLQTNNTIVIDPDSRMSQLGLIPLCEPDHYFHFQSRTAGGDGPRNLSHLVSNWLQQTFNATPEPAYIAPKPETISSKKPSAAVSLGVGDNDSKRIPGNFESQLLALLGQKYSTIYIDRGAGGEEASRVTAAVETAGLTNRVHFCEGSFAAFASIISQCNLYVGYDSAGQHAAAAACIPLITIFAGAPSTKFRDRWNPRGPGSITCIGADARYPDAALAAVKLELEGEVE